MLTALYICVTNKNTFHSELVEKEPVALRGETCWHNISTSVILTHTGKRDRAWYPDAAMA